MILVVATLLGVFLLAWWLCARHLQWTRADALTAAGIATAVATVPLGAWFSAVAGRIPLFGRLEINPVIHGQADGEPLTLAQLSWVLWGRDRDAAYAPGSSRRRYAERLARTNAGVRGHLESAVRMVPYCYAPGLPNRDLTGPDARRVGLLGAAVTLDIRLRNLGTETAGIRLRPAPDDSELRPRALRRAGGWATYSIFSLSEERVEVTPGRPVAIQARLQLKAARAGLPEYDPIGFLRVSREFADYLTSRIDGVGITGILDNGDKLDGRFRVQIPDATTIFAIEAFDVAELRTHIDAIDAAVKDTLELQLRQSNALRELNELRVWLTAGTTQDTLSRGGV